MAKLRVFDKVGLGEFIINAAKDEAARAKFLEDPTKALSKFIEIPPDRKNEQGELVKHEVSVIEDTKDITYIVLPWKDDVLRALDHIEDQPNVYPLEYRPGTPEYIDDTRFPLKALFFRFGEYMFGRCR
ncbi:MAG: hypothetical protein R3D05_08130 [Dongiaceae bacterium]